MGAHPADAALERWACHMMLGEFESAWQDADHVDAFCLNPKSGFDAFHGDLPRHLRRVWRGESLRGKRVLVRCYHGLGDTIQFIRFIPSLREIVRSVTVECQAPLIPLLRRMPGIARLCPLDDPISPMGREVEIELMEAPRAMRATLATLPGREPYIRVPERLVRDAEDELRRMESPGSKGSRRRPRVGIVWSSGDWNAGRSTRLRDWIRVLRMPGISFFSLQRGPGAAELDGLKDRVRMITGETESGTPLDTAAKIMNLDLVISVDTMVAHLAGALGKPVWTLLPFQADWRWMVERDDSPWYPTMRLFRQPRPGAWGPVLARVAARLRGF